MMLGRQNEFHWLGTVGAQRERLWTRSVRLAKAKVAGSNPVFRSKSPGFRALGGSGLFMAFAFHGDAARSQRLRGVVALRGEPAHWRIVPMPFPGSLEQGWNICLRLNERPRLRSGCWRSAEVESRSKTARGALEDQPPCFRPRYSRNTSSQ